LASRSAIGVEAVGALWLMCYGKARGLRIRRSKNQGSVMAATLAELDTRIAAVRENIRELTEQAAAYSGAEDDARTADRIAEQEQLLAALLKERQALAGR
jgi:hypothetical protein